MAPNVSRRLGYKSGPVVLRHEWPKSIKKQLVTEENPNGTIRNSDLDLASGLLHLQALVQYCNVCKRTVLSKTDNLNALFWQCKDSAATDACPSHLRCLFRLHQQFHQYVLCFGYLTCPSNPLANAFSCLFQLSNNLLLTHLQSLSPQKHSLSPQKLPFQMLWLKPSVVSPVISVLQKMPCKKESLLVKPKPPNCLGSMGKILS